MKTIDKYLTEKLVINNKVKRNSWFPKSKEELINDIITIIKNADKKRDVDLNCINVSDIEDMSSVFSTVNKTQPVYKIDISSWDLSKVKTTKNMFTGCRHLQVDTSMLDVSNIEDMQGMFFGCEKFNSDFKNWNVGKCKNFTGMFAGCKMLDCDFSTWDLTDIDKSKTKWMFSNCSNLTNTQFPVGFKR